MTQGSREIAPKAASRASAGAGDRRTQSCLDRTIALLLLPGLVAQAVTAA